MFVIHFCRQLVWFQGQNSVYKDFLIRLEKKDGEFGAF